MRQTRLITIGIIVLSLLLAVGVYSMPVPAYISSGSSYISDVADYRSGQAFTAFSVGISLGYVALFLLGTRQGFSPSFKKTYYWITAGGILLTVGTLVYMFNVYKGTVDTDGASLQGEIPLAAGILVIYWGLYTFSKLVQGRAPSIQLLFVAGLLLGTGAILWFLPHKAGLGLNENLFDIANVFSSIETVAYLICGVLALRIRAIASAQYAPSLAWCAASMFSAFFTAGMLLSFDFIHYPQFISADTLSGIFIITNLLTLVWAYSFNKISYTSATTPSQGNTFLDAITMLASLVSRPAEVDPILEDLRQTTGAHPVGQPFSSQENARLQNVYRQLQDYLVTKERIRTFNHAQLDSMVQERYGINPLTTT